jgi:hypothetical protein
MWDDCMDSGVRATQEAKAEIVFSGGIPDKISFFKIGKTLKKQ